MARALDLHSRGQGFDSLILHFFHLFIYMNMRRCENGKMRWRENKRAGSREKEEKKSISIVLL